MYNCLWCHAYLRASNQSSMGSGMSTRGNQCPMEEQWKAEIDQILASATSCTAQDESTMVPGFEHVHIVRQGTHIYVAKTLSEEEGASEAQMLRKLHHPAINVLINVVPGARLGCLVLHLEYCKHGNLFDYLIRNPDPVSTSPYLLLWLDQLLTALVHMHEKGVVHCDIKAENIFIKSAKQVVIGDFGLAQDADEEGNCEKGDRGTLRFMPPEQLDQMFRLRTPPKHSYLSDVWGLGCVVHEIMDGLKHRKKYDWMVEGVRNGVLKEPDGVLVKPEHARSREIATEVRAQALALDPQHRPSAQALLDKFYRLTAQESPVKKQKTRDNERPAAH